MTAPISTPEAHLRIAALASDPRVHRAFRWLHLHERQLRRWQLEFLAIPAPTFAEADRARWFLGRFHSLGLANPHIDAAGNALAELPAAADGVPHVPILEHGTEPSNPLNGTGFSPSINSPENRGASAPEGAAPDTPILLLSAHLDTVFPAGTDCTPHAADTGPIHGPGACDNGAGLTALLAIAAALQHAALTPACTILFAANTGEEGEGDLHGIRHLFTASPYAHRIRAAIALEGSGAATVVDRALGSRRLRVTVTGPGGHSWADAGRPNPILALAAALLAITTLPLPTKPRTTLNVGAIHGGTSVNSIPESATADLDLRSTSTLQLDRTELAILQTLTSTIETETSRHLKNPVAPSPALRLPKEPTSVPSNLGAPGPASGTWESGDLHLHVTRIGDRPAAALAPSSPLALSLRAVDRHLNLATDSRIGSTDANLPLSLNIPALAIGAGGTAGGIHTLAEWYSPLYRDLALRRIFLLLLDTCALLTE